MRSSSTSDTEREEHEPDLSLEEMFWDAERLELTPEKVRSAMNARHSQVRKELLAAHGLTEETLNGAPEDLKAELGAKLMYELAHSPEAKLERGFHDAAVARENRLLVKRKAEEILAAQQTYSQPIWLALQPPPSHHILFKRVSSNVLLAHSRMT
jgi:hypothetical protein